MDRDYIFLAATRTLCNECQQPVDGKIVYNQDGVFILKQCPEHGQARELLEEDTAYHLQKYQFDKPGTTSSTQTVIHDGCPLDCGLCPAHDQHTCIGLIEVTHRCDLGCTTCYADSGSDKSGQDLSLARIGQMMDFYLAAENGKAEILQISGGEPTLHPEIIEIIRMARNKGFGYVMLNTNGLRLARDPAFAAALQEFQGRFEVYLQFDALDDKVYRTMRGKSLLAQKQAAIRQLTDLKIPTTLVCTVAAGVNDHLLGELVAFGLQEPCVRGINFQPLALFGRLPDQARDRRITLSGILGRIEKQTSRLIRQSDFMPLPCNVERVAITYLMRQDNGYVPITRDKDMREYRHVFNNTFMFTVENTLSSLQDQNPGFGVCNCCDLARDLKKFIPLNFLFKSREEKIRFVDENTFRISVNAFVDLYNYDQKAMQKECVHIITPGLKRIPFSAYNLVHRSRDDHWYNGAGQG